MSSCAILQPSYLSWRGLFHQIQKADVFVFYDDVQYDKHGWRNRNRVKTANGPAWLTIPVRHKGNVTEGKPLGEIEIVWDSPWNTKHWATITQAYRKAPGFAQLEPLLAGFYARHDRLLVDLTIDLTVALARELGLTTRFARSSTLGIGGERSGRLVAILAALGADHYVSGPSARAYLDESLFASAGMTVEYMRYDYPEYEQLHGPYEPQVSILDLMFMKGRDAGKWIWTS